ncbi:MAG: cytochrome c [Betaproteobacteria bacterium]|nr:cytochrome c [Betaproteobacteria bacterium]
MPGSAWIAPNLLDDSETGLASTPLDQIIRLLGAGRAAHASALGPMAEVVQHGLQYLDERDLRAMAIYLQGRAREQAPRAATAREGTRSNAGAEVYRTACADCHGDSGEGQPGRYPALRGNRAVLQSDPTNTVLAVLHGGYTPVTAGNPTPPGMPPFALGLSSTELASVISWIRGGLQGASSGAPAVTAPLVERVRNRSR